MNTCTYCGKDFRHIFANRRVCPACNAKRPKHLRGKPLPPPRDPEPQPRDPAPIPAPVSRRLPLKLTAKIIPFRRRFVRATP